MRVGEKIKHASTPPPPHPLTNVNDIEYWLLKMLIILDGEDCDGFENENEDNDCW